MILSGTMTGLFPVFLLAIVVGIESFSLVKDSNSIIDVTIECGANLTANNPVLSILTDVDISAVAKCKNGEKRFTSTDLVHYTLPATLTSRDNLCELNEKDGSDNFDIDVEVHYGELDSLILTKTKVVTVVCTYSGFGLDDSAQHSILEGPQAHVEIQSIVGGTVPAGDVNLRIQTVYDQDAVGSIAFDRRYSLYASYTGTEQNVGMKPVSCDAVSDDGERYAVLVAGCGDGFIFDRSDGFITTGTTFRSPYFFAFHLANSGNLAFNCNVTLCSPSCDGSSCETVCGTVTSFGIPNTTLGDCSGEKYQDTCAFECILGHGIVGDGISTCGADGVWTVPNIACPPKDCGNPPPGTSSTGVASSGTTYTKTADYTCDEGHQKLSGDDAISCLDTGAWDMDNALVCEPKDCGTPPNGTASFAIAPSTKFGDSASYMCVENTKGLGGDKSIQCLASGQWDAGNLMFCQCTKPLDVVFALDGSPSVEIGNFTAMINTLADALPRFRIASNGIKLGVVVFDGNIEEVIPFQADSAAIASGLHGLRYDTYLGGYTAAGVGIQRAQRMLNEDGRPAVQDVIVLFADGISSPTPFAQATAAKNTGTIIHALGITDGANMPELRQVASTSSHALKANTWSDLPDMVQEIFDNVCA